MKKREVYVVRCGFLKTNLAPCDGLFISEVDSGTGICPYCAASEPKSRIKRFFSNLSLMVH